MKKVLFLDFDGVLHPNFCSDKEYFNRIELLVDILSSRTTELEVVISSSWRFHYAFDEILNFFPEDLRVLISGVTPEVEIGRHQRYREIRAYLKSCAGGMDWRALDDDVVGFPKECKELIVCDGLVGIDGKSSMQLRKWLLRRP